MTVRLGLIGAGAVGARHARTLAGFEDVELVGICDPARPAAAALAVELDVPRAEDLEGLGRGGGGALWPWLPPFAAGGPGLAGVRAGVARLLGEPARAGL